MLPYVFRSLLGFPRDLARSLGKDATLGDVLQTLDEYYGVVMKFNTLNKDLYSLKQGMGENVVEFRVHLSQQVQILQMEYPSRIQQEHVEEVKWDCFYEGLSATYQQMLAHKVNGENPFTYSELLLAAQKLERWVEARDPLLPNTTTGEKEAASSAEEDAGMLGKVGNVDPSLGYIMQFANVVELYQKKNHNCFGCGSPDHLVKDCPKDLRKTARKVGLNLQEGTEKKGG